MSLATDLLEGIVVESRTKSLTGPLFYSDKTYPDREEYFHAAIHCDLSLNALATYHVIGIAVGITRMALAVIHTIGHSFAALVTFDKGHCFHVAKGACEFLRGFIESIPFVGRKFATWYYEHGMWWMIKIYNPNAPDSLDLHTNHWSYLKQRRPTAYVVA